MLPPTEAASAEGPHFKSQLPLPTSIRAGMNRPAYSLSKPLGSL
jgi:hypothetical protein